MLQSGAAARPVPAWGGVKSGRARPENTAAAGRRARRPGARSGRARPRVECHRRLDPCGVGVYGPARPVLSALRPKRVHPPLRAGPFPHSSGGQAAIDSAGPGNVTLGTHLWRVRWQIAQKAKNTPGVHGSGETGCCSRPQVQLFLMSASEVTASPRAAQGSEHFSTPAFLAPS